MLVRYTPTAEQTGQCVKVETEFAHDGHRKCVFKSSSPVVRKGGARETGHELSVLNHIPSKTMS